jgi:hypothetical protein
MRVWLNSLLCDNQRQMTTKWYNEMFPRNLLEWIAMIGFYLYVGKTLYIFSGISGSDSANCLIAKAGFIGLFCAVAATIANGVRWIGVRRQSWKTRLTLSIGLIIPLALISLGVYSHFTSYRFEALFLPGDHFEKRLAEKLSRSDLSNESRSGWSKLYAEIVYVEHGRIIVYTSPDGKQIPYEPAEKDKENRDIQVAVKRNIEFLKSSMIELVYTWSCCILLGIACGLLARRRWKAKLT